MLSCYLAGAMSQYLIEDGNLDRAISWRKEILRGLEDTNIRIFDPTLKFQFNKDYNMSGILPQNRLYLEKCDILILNRTYLEYSPGTMYEISVASYLNKPIISFGESKWDSYAHIESMITVSFDTIEEVCDYLHNMYCQL